MRKILIQILIIVVAFSLVACNDNGNLVLKQEPSAAPSPVEWKAAYAEFLKDLHSGDQDPKSLYKSKERKDFVRSEWAEMEFYYAIKDLDGNGIPELVIKSNRMNVTVYTFSDTLIKTGNVNFLTGTLRLLTSESYPGIFTFDVGGSKEWHGYLTIKDNKLVYGYLWTEEYSAKPRRERIKECTNDKGIIKESKRLYKEDEDLLFKKVIPRNFSQLQ